MVAILGDTAMEDISYAEAARCNITLRYMIVRHDTGIGKFGSSSAEVLPLLSSKQ